MRVEDIKIKVEEKIGSTISGPMRTEFPVAQTQEGYEIRQDGDLILVGYLSPDPEPRDFWADADELGELKRFTRAEDPNGTRSLKG